MPALATYASTLQSALDASARAHKVPGAVAGVVRADDRIVVATGTANVATGVETTPDTVFQIGSVSKLFTSLLTMQLVQSSLVELDEPVRGALQEFRVRDEAATLTITPRHLLSHTSGIEGDHLRDCGRNPDALWRYVSTLDDVGQIHPPDEMYSYCNAGFGVLGRLVEEQTGDHFGKALYKRLLRPLGLERTFTMAEQAITHRVAAGHSHGAKGEPSVLGWALLGSFNAPVGGILSTADDLLTFAEMLVRGGKNDKGKQLIAAKTLATMFEGHVDMPGGPETRGLGFVDHGWDATKVVGHDGDTIGQRAFLRVLPERDAAFVLLTNSPFGGKVFDDLIAGVGPDLFDAEPPPAPEVDEDRFDEGPDADECTAIYERLHQRLAIAGGGDGSLRMTLIPDEVFASAGMTERTLRLDRLDARRWRTHDPIIDEDRIVTMLGDRPDYVHFAGRAHRRIS